MSTPNAGRNAPVSISHVLLTATALTVCFGMPARAQSQQNPEPLEIVVTPNRGASDVQRTGSAVTVISSAEIAKASPASMLDVLRGVPGLSINESGGPGKLSAVLIRGAEGRHTMVMIDGIRVGDTSSTGTEFDFANLALTDIERIEVLRGPQSALYGSDAIGGVINIITRKGRGAPKASIQIEGGSYNTQSLLASVSGGTREFSYAFAVSGVRSDGFSAYGYRIPRLERAYGPLDNDGYQRLAGSARVSWRPSDVVEIEAGVYSGRTRSGYDAAFAGFGFLPDTPSKAVSLLTTGYTRAKFDAFDGRLRNQVTLYGNVTERNLYDVQRYDFGFGLTDEHNRYDFRGERLGAEYQGDLSLNQFGKLTFGAGVERESASTKTTPGLNSFTTPASASYDRLARSLFALHQVTLLDRVDLSLGGRMDDVEGTKTFFTERATAAYRHIETGTKFRASAGTGAKAPSLYQQYSVYAPTRSGDPALRPEYSVGYDAGIDQSLFGGRLVLSGTVFANRIRNMIDFDFTRGSIGSFGTPIGEYVNVARVKTKGVELSGDATVWQGVLSVKGSYTFLDARNAMNDYKLARRPMHQGRVAFTITPIDRLSIEPVIYVVGSRFSTPGQKDKLAPYARFDLRAEYKLNANLDLFVRGENLTNARYQEVATYGTTGRAVYAGARATW